MPTSPTVSRPHMPGYGIAAANEGVLLPWAFVEERMAMSHNYWISSTRPDGNPHAAPVWGFWYDGVFYFGTGDESQKARNFAHNPNIVVHLESGDETVILEGEVEVFNDEKIKKGLNKVSKEKYGMGIMGSSPLFRLRIQRAFAWREKDFPTSATRWTFE